MFITFESLQPPHMRSVQKSIQNSQVGRAKLQQSRETRYLAAKELRDSYKPELIPKPTLHRKLSHYSIASSDTSRTEVSRPPTSVSRVSSRPTLEVPTTPVSVISAAGSSSLASGLPSDDRLAVLEARLQQLEEKQRLDEQLLRARDKKLATYQEVLTSLVDAVDRAKTRKGASP